MVDWRVLVGRFNRDTNSLYIIYGLGWVGLVAVSYIAARRKRPYRLLRIADCHRSDRLTNVSCIVPIWR